MEGNDLPDDSVPDVRGLVRKKLLGTVSDLHKLGIADTLQARIIACLIVGRRTVAELVEEIYGCRNADTGYMSAYSKTRRGIRELESRGYVATRLLGKDKPYRLTHYALGKLSGLGEHGDRERLVSRKDLAVYIASVILLTAAVSILLGVVEPPETYLVWFYALFFTFLGISLTRLAETISRVM